MRRDYADGSVLLGDDFWQALNEDILAAKARVIIYSPFVGMWQLKQRFDEIFAVIIERQVRICIILQPPYLQRDNIQTEEQFNGKKLEFDQCVAWLKRKNIHVSFRKEIHEKLVVIDEHILWDGSKNVLAQGKSSERMNRFINRQRVIDAIIDHKLADCTDCEKVFSELGLHHIGGQLERNRTLMNKSRRKLANEANLDHTNLAKIENGQRSPKMETISALSPLLRVKVVLIPEWLVSSVAYLLIRSERAQNLDTVSISFAPAHDQSMAVREPPAFSNDGYLALGSSASVMISFSAQKL